MEEKLYRVMVKHIARFNSSLKWTIIFIWQKWNI